MKRMITGDDVAAAHAKGVRVISAPPATTVVTPSAWSKARELGVVLGDRGDAHAPPGEGRAGQCVDASGITLVRGGSVQLGPFAPAGPGKDVRLQDVITAKNGAPMTAGFMSWAKKDSFPWSLDYDEIDLVLEGVLHVQIDGRTVEAKQGDVVYIPKGSRIVFATPSRVRVFYVTYPADWSTAAASPARPQK